MSEPADRMRVLELFEEGKRFTEELLRENERLRSALAGARADARAESTSPQQAVRPSDRVRELEEELARRRQENEELRRQFLSVEEENRDFAERYLSVEQQNSELISMYVASYRLHSTLKLGEVIEVVKEIIINLVGAERFGIYVVDQHQRLQRLADEGLEGVSVDERSEPLQRCLAERQLFLLEGAALEQHDGSSPAACIPLCVGDEVRGVVLIYELLNHKEGFVSQDFALFDLLGAHLATAIMAAMSYECSERKRATLEGCIELLRPTYTAVAGR